MFPSQSRLYGKGIFTTIAFRSGKPLFPEKHWRRLVRDSDIVGIDLSQFTEMAVFSAVVDAIGKSGRANGRIRITLYDETAGKVWPSDEKVIKRTALDVIAGGPRPAMGPLRLTFSPYPLNSRSPLAGVKSCNYLEQILSLDEAKARGFHEAVRPNERGHITSGCMSNIFWAKGGQLFTPAPSTGCLPGTTREFILENLECEEVEAEIGELNYAEAIYMTSAGIGIAAAAEFDGRQLPNPPHPITELFPTR